MKFMNPSNNYIEEVSSAGLWTLLFGFFYLAYKGAWLAAIIAFGLAIFTGGFSWLVFPFFASRSVEKSYLQKGWIKVENPS